MRRRLFRISVAVFLGLVLFGFFYALPRMFVDTKNTGFHRSIFQEAEYVSIESFDELKLEAFILEPNIKPKSTILLIHGLRACKEFYKERALELQKLGYRVVAPDLRAHGNSEGTYCTFGVKEKHDVKKWVDFICLRYPDEEIGIWGQSLGGAISLQAMSIEPRIKFGIVESTFANFTDVGRDYLQRYFGFRLTLLNDFIEWRVASIGDFEPKQASPEFACKKILQPILLVHGEKDKNINVKYAHQNFGALSSKEKRLILFPEATHNNVWEHGGYKYLKEVSTFMDRSLD